MDATLDVEAISHQEHWLRQAISGGWKDQQVSEEQRLRLGALKDSFFAGERSALLDAIAFCAQQQLVLSWWSSVAFVQLLYNTRSGKYRSWDEAFGRPHPKGSHLKKVQRDHDLMGLVYAEVCRLREMEPGTPIDDVLFERIAEVIGIGKTLCKELYYRAKNQYEPDATFWESGSTLTVHMGEVEL